MTTKSETKDTKKRRASDAELRTMGKVLGLLSDLDLAARKRVVEYLNERLVEELAAAAEDQS